MKVITLLTLFMLICAPFMAKAELLVTSVKVECGPTKLCQSRKDRFLPLIDKFRNTTHLRQTLKLLASRGGFKDFVWELNPVENGNELLVSYSPKMLISSIKVRSNDDKLKGYVELSTRLRIDEWFDASEFPQEQMLIRQSLSSKGYPRAEVKISSKEVDEGVHIAIRVEPHAPQLLKAFHVKTDSTVVKHFATMKFNEILNKPFDSQFARVKADELENELFSFGYYLASVSLTPRADGTNAVLEIAVAPVELYTFDLKQTALDVKLEWGPMVKDLFRRYRRPLDPATLQLGVQEQLNKRGYLRPEVKVLLRRITNSQNETINAFQLEMKPGDRTRVRKVSFPGAMFWSDARLQKMWNEQAHELSAAGFFDEDSNTAFAEWLRGQYIRNGFVRTEISKPQVTFISPTEASIEYNIVEGPQVLVDGIIISGLTEAETDEVLQILGTKESNPFNPYQFADDVRNVTELMQNKGYYYAEVVNRDADDIVNYGKDRASVRLHIKIRKGKYIEFNRFVIVGNRRTRDHVIKRKSLLKRGKPLTPAGAKEYENTLSATGLFNSVRVRPINHKGETPLTDLAVEVTERDYGLVELAPGYRTDIGVKLSGTISYMNLLGSNRSISLTGLVNQRLDLQTLDQRRRDEGKRMLEYNLGVQYNQPDIFDTFVDYGASANFQRRRFFSFDADILRLANTFSRDFGARYSVAIRHQFERIKQFDATEDRDNGSFTIGALTPSFTADFRNTRINPTSGAWFNVSNEYANPYFLSQKNDDLTINFYKFISRNRFYIPIPKGTVAISLVGGIQENLANEYKTGPNGAPVVTEGIRETKGYIPNIKLFRLTGTDIVRGFSDEEINRLTNGNDIGTDRVQRRAYMANFKFEPRYFINDTLMAGVFYDAGRVYKDEVDFGELRDSVGITFKVVTPVGTLDFDYGHKLDREREPDGKLESPGRFHVSIGFF